MSIFFIGRFTDDNQSTRARDRFIDPLCERLKKGDSELVTHGKVLNLHLLLDKFGEDNNGSTTLLDLFLHHPAEKILSHLDGNVTGIYTTPTSTVIFRDKNGGGLPVFYSQTHFSNHIEGIKTNQTGAFQPNLESIAFYLEHGYIPSPHSAFEGISKIPAGHLLVCQDGKISLCNAFPFSDFTEPVNTLRISEAEAVECYIQLHRDAIGRRIAGADEVGVLLSGGYDSAGNLVRLRDQYQGVVKSYSVGFKSNPLSELGYAGQIANQYNSEHYTYEMEGHEIEFLPEIVNQFCEPFQESGLMLNLCVMKLLVGNHPSPVTLCGEGNDQLFGTAGRDLAMHYLSKKTGFSLFQTGFDALFRKRSFLQENLLYKLQFHNNKILNILESDRFGFTPAEQSKLLQQVPVPFPGDSMYPNRFSYSDFNQLYLGKTYFLDLQQQTNEIIVHKAATCSRVYHNHLEFPHLDMDIYRFITGLPVSDRLHGSLSELLLGKGISKYLYKQSLKGLLPHQAVARKKQGGFVPMSIFFTDPSRRKRILEYIMQSDMTKRLLQPDVLVRYFNQFSNGIQNQKIWFWYYQFHCFQVFSLLILAIWWDQFINNKPFQKLSDYIGVEVK